MIILKKFFLAMNHVMVCIIWVFCFFSEEWREDKNKKQKEGLEPRKIISHANRRELWRKKKKKNKGTSCALPILLKVKESMNNDGIFFMHFIFKQRGE